MTRINSLMMRFVVWLCLFALPLVTGNAAPAVPNIAISGSFEVQLWGVPKNPDLDSIGLDEIPANLYVKQVQKDTKVCLFLLVKNPAVDNGGNSNVTARMVIRRPDGSVFKEVKRIPCWTAKVAFPRDKLTGGRQVVWIELDDDDPAGLYSVVAIVTDNVSQNQVTLNYAVEFQ